MMDVSDFKDRFGSFSTILLTCHMKDESDKQRAKTQPKTLTLAVQVLTREML